MLKDALFQNEGNVSAVARQFGITARAVHKKLKNCGIDSNVYRQRSQPSSLRQ
jgi:DNA-binding NtrC family response regulator